jgi:hypothetical protein
VEREHAAAARVRVVAVGEPRLRAGRLVDEREGVDRWPDPLRQAVDVLPALVLHLDQSGPLGLRLDHPGRLAVNEKEIVDPAVTFLQDELPDRYPRPGGDVRAVGMLNDPAGRGKLPVNVLPGLRLAGEIGILRAGHEP